MAPSFILACVRWRGWLYIKLRLGRGGRGGSWEIATGFLPDSLQAAREARCSYWNWLFCGIHGTLEPSQMRPCVPCVLSFFLPSLHLLHPPYSVRTSVYRIQNLSKRRRPSIQDNMTTTFVKQSMQSKPDRSEAAPDRGISEENIKNNYLIFLLKHF